ncbi:MAG: hypothetical protein ACE5GN_07475, partial [Waddliaceae bacterium]
GMKSTNPAPPRASELEKYFKLDDRLKGLTAAQRQKVLDKCIASYGKSVSVFETVIGEVAAEQPDAKKCTQEMLRRISRIAKAYQEIQFEGRDDLSPVLKELKIRLGSDVEFATYGDGTSPGSIGFNPLAIEKAMREGTLREQMLLIYSSLWTALPKIFDSPEMVAKVNKKLKGDFQINTNLLKELKKKAESKGEADPVKIFFSQSEPLQQFRDAGGRVWDPDRPKEPPPKIKNIKDMTIREARATLGEYISKREFEAMKTGEAEGKALGEHRVQWVRGKDLFRVAEGSDFYQRAVALGGLPIITGPSGTTDGFLKGIAFLSMQGFEKKTIVALTGWMVPAGDHSLHEIRVAGTWFGLDYPEGPKAFEDIYPEDSNFQDKIGDKMAERGFKLPGYYLGRDFQCKVAKELGFFQSFD